jgi:phenylpyruvate tautomerase PptA (4-oxalocrotonate tautomerase family)
VRDEAHTDTSRGVLGGVAGCTRPEELGRALATIPGVDFFWVNVVIGADFRFDPSYPDLKSARADDFALIEILWSVGRSVKVRRKLLDELMGTLSAAGMNTENVMVCFKETTWENWAFGGGRLIHV